mgnify:CR=1 FL=1|tara:strand:+ start:2873 stop:3097 length:225 start_codon:yes stop_codon:yes gene_type:complete
MPQEIELDPKQVLIDFVLNNLDKPRCAQLLLFIGVFDDNVQFVEQALDKGAHVNHSMTGGEKRILEAAGYSIPQ